MIGFVSLAGIVVNDSILLVKFVKRRSMDGMVLHVAAGQTVRNRFRGIFLTSITTIAGMLPLLSETSLQAQVLVPLVASVVSCSVWHDLIDNLIVTRIASVIRDYEIFSNS